MRRRHDEEYTVIEPSYSMSYTIDPYGTTHKTPRRPFFSLTELKNIAIAVSVLIIALTLVLSKMLDMDIPSTIALAVLAVFLGFFSHEMAHKVLARKYGCWSEFRANMRGLGLALLMSFFGFLFAAPGAVYIVGHITREQNGKISVVGPFSNLIIAAACLPFLEILALGVPEVVERMALVLLFFNAFLAAFNMVPIPPLDGSKVWAWSKPIYVVAMATCALMFVIALIAWGAAT
ncbi:MAG: site-2 protease family protein [Candidatus Thermoplasmatota archaeon]|nr:site-2 protease family protein [Candidatus Thermoplasmatota archaeon]